jgi:hypothetical protein
LRPIVPEPRAVAEHAAPAPLIEALAELLGKGEVGSKLSSCCEPDCIVIFKVVELLERKMNLCHV